MISHPMIPVLSARPIRAISGLIDPTLHAPQADAVLPISISWIVVLCLVVSIGSLLAAIGHGLGLHENPYTWIVFWTGVVLLLLPATRIAAPVVARGERIFLLILLAEGIILYKNLYSPTSFVQFDEMLHWMSAHSILVRHKLFLYNSLLPISPYYPALEIVTTTLANLAGVTIFPAAVLLLIVIRAAFIVGLFLFFEKLSGSTRIAAIGSVVYMCSTTFAIFESMFAYESLGLVLCVMIALAELEINRSDTYTIRALALPGVLLATLTVTHHVSAFWMAAYLICLMLIDMVRRTPQRRRLIRVLLIGLVLLGITFPLIWASVKGNPLLEYLAPTIQEAIESFYRKIIGESAGRKMFVADDGTVQPIGIQLIGMASTLLIAIGLATGFFRSLCLTAPPGLTGWSRFIWIMRRRWTDSRVILVTITAFGFPVSVILRLSSLGWEIGHRMNTFVFFGVGFVVAAGIVHFWQANRWNRVVVNVSLVTMLLGAVMISSGYHAVRNTYKVSADPDSIEHMGINTASWTKQWLGPGHRFAADRVNRSLLGTYGDQDVVSSMQRIDISRTFFSKGLTAEALYPIRAGKLDYILVDLRLTTARAVLGEYFEKSEGSGGYPPPVKNLLKLENEDKAARIYDNGTIIIYDVHFMH